MSAPTTNRERAAQLAVLRSRLITAADEERRRLEPGRTIARAYRSADQRTGRAADLQRQHEADERRREADTPQIAALRAENGHLRGRRRLDIQARSAARADCRRLVAENEHLRGERDLLLGKINEAHDQAATASVRADAGRLAP